MSLTPWMQISLISFALAFPFFYLWRWVFAQEISQSASSRFSGLVSSNIFFALICLLLAGLYATSISKDGSFDEFNYAIGLRERGIFPGYNHFLTHFLGFMVYWPVHRWFTDTKMLLEVLNIGYTLATLLVVRQISLEASVDRAIANSSALILGLSYGVWKYASSAEVYPLLLLMWALSVYQGIRIYNGHDSWGQFLLLSVLSNLTVLSHDLSSYMCLGFMLAFLFVEKERRRILLSRYIVTGLLLLPLFLMASGYLMGFRTVDGFIQHHLYYHIHPDTSPGDYHYTILGNVFLVAREGLYSMFVGIESAWRSFPFYQRVLAIGIHATVAALLAYLYFSGWINMASRRRTEGRSFFPLILVLCNWLTVYGVCIFLRPDDEFHYWLLPFTVLSVSLALAEAAKPIRDACVTVMMLLAVTVFLGASGLYSAGTVKLLNETGGEMSYLKDLPNSSQVVFNDGDNAMAFRYYKPAIRYLRDGDQLKAALKSGNDVYVEKAWLASFSPTYVGMPTLYPYYFHLTKAVSHG